MSSMQCSNKGAKKGLQAFHLHTAIGLLIMLLFYLLPPIGAITPIGMKCVGAFLGMVYLWSTVGTLWPSLLGLMLIGLSGYAGEGVQGFNKMILQAFGNSTVLLILFAMILFGALYEEGCTTYIAQWFITRPIITGRPYVFLFFFFLSCYVLGALVSATAALIMIWPMALSLASTLNIKRDDAIWPYFFIGAFFATTIANPLLPFKGAPLVILSAYEKMSGNPVPYGPYILLCLAMSVLMLFLYVVAIKFILRPNIDQLKNVTAESIRASNPLPTPSLRQRLYLLMIPIYIAMVVLPGFFPKNTPVLSLFGQLGALGVTLLWVVILSILRIEGKPLMDFRDLAYKQFNWGIFFMIAAAVYGANTLSAESTGVRVFLVESLKPILGGKSEYVFVALLFAVALFITNFANNAAMAVVLMPVVVAFSANSGVDSMPVAIGICLMVFVAMLTPAACPGAGLMWGRRDLYTPQDILRIGIPLSLLGWMVYVFIAYPLAKVFFM